MAEIKSTLDLVLEKTRNLTLGSVEKQEQQRKEIETRLRSLLQKYLDGGMTRERLKGDYAASKKENVRSTTQALIDEVLDRMELQRDNQNPLELLPGFKYTENKTARFRQSFSVPARFPL
jgi:hypothetical protein